MFDCSAIQWHVPVQGTSLDDELDGLLDDGLDGLLDGELDGLLGGEPQSVNTVCPAYSGGPDGAGQSQFGAGGQGVCLCHARAISCILRSTCRRLRTLEDWVVPRS